MKRQFLLAFQLKQTDNALTVSRLALLEEAAVRLMGKGHLAARLPGEDDLVIPQVRILKNREDRTYCPKQ